MYDCIRLAIISYSPILSSIIPVHGSTALLPGYSNPSRAPLPVPPSPLELMNVYRKIHDPDALHGVAQSASLTLQALKYTHTGT